MQTKLNFIDVFDNTNPVIVEIGFGMGKATAIIAEQNPDKNYLGIEVHTPGVGKLLGEIRTKDLHNLYIIQHDAMEVLETMLPDNSVSAFHVFFPDPWPKKKHHKRRIIQSDFVSLLARKLRKGGYIYLVTDWEEYAEWMMDIISQEKLLANRFDGFASPSAWRPMTKFERKGLDKDYKINELMFERI